MGALFFVSTTGISTPSLDAKLLFELGLSPNLKRVPVWGLGCAGGAVAVEAADVVLTGDRLGTLVEARELAGRSYRLTFTNVVLALSFNGAGVLAAISGLVAPVWAMLAMAASVGLVLANSFAGRLLPERK